MGVFSGRGGPFGGQNAAQVSFIPTLERGMAQGMRDALTWGGAGINGILSHTGHYSPVQGFARSKVVFATTYQTGTQLQDTDLPDPLYFQCALEPVFQPLRTGLAARTLLYKSGGAKFASYNGPGTNPACLLESDWLYHPYISPGSNNRFGLYTYVERQSGTGAVCYSDNGSGYVERGEGYKIFNAGSSPAGPQLANDPVLNVTALDALTASQTGGTPTLTPAFMILDYGTEVKVIALSGDSIGQQVGEGVAGSGTTSDGLGSALRNCGYPARGVVETLGLSPAVNLAKASDGTKFSAQVGAMRGRLARLRRANPTHLLMEEVLNDFGTGGLTASVANWAANTFYGYGEVRLNGGNAYIVTRGGQSAASGGPTGTGASITDGQAIWRYLGGGGTAIGTDRQYIIYSRLAQVAAAYRTAVPGLKICKTLPTQSATPSTDSWATTANQTPTYSAGDTVPRGKLFGLLFADRTAGDKTIGDTWFEPGAATISGVKFEDGYDGTVAGLTGKFGVNGTANFLTADGGHPNSVGHKGIGDSFTAAMFP